MRQQLLSDTKEVLPVLPQPLHELFLQQTATAVNICYTPKHDGSRAQGTEQSTNYLFSSPVQASNKPSPGVNTASFPNSSRAALISARWLLEQASRSHSGATPGAAAGGVPSPPRSSAGGLPPAPDSSPAPAAPRPARSRSGAAGGTQADRGHIRSGQVRSGQVRWSGAAGGRQTYRGQVRSGQLSQRSTADA